MSRLRPDAVPKQLTTTADRIAFLRAAGADDVFVLEPTPELLALAPVDFIRELRTSLAFDVIVEGEDFRFGRSRSGSIETLAHLGASMGFRAETLAGVDVELRDLSIV